jgi:hypothetical protein
MGIVNSGAAWPRDSWCQYGVVILSDAKEPKRSHVSFASLRMTTEGSL